MYSHNSLGMIYIKEIIMPQYLALAEKVIKDIKEEVGIERDQKGLFTLIILKVREYTHSSNLKVDHEICATIFDDENKIEGIKRLDLTLIPRISNEDEFLLWLAGFIQHITIDESKKDQIPLSIVMKQRALLHKDLKNKIPLSDSNLRHNSGVWSA